MSGLFTQTSTAKSLYIQFGRRERIQTFNIWFWRPPLYRLSYAPMINMPQKERAEAGLEPATIGLANPWLYQLSYSAVQRRMSKRAAVETRRRVPMTVCGPGTQHDRHQAVFLRPLFPRYHYINQFIRKHELR